MTPIPRDCLTHENFAKWEGQIRAQRARERVQCGVEKLARNGRALNMHDLSFISRKMDWEDVARTAALTDEFCNFTIGTHRASEVIAGHTFTDLEELMVWVESCRLLRDAMLSTVGEAQ